MFGLTSLGAVHTAISLVALLAGTVALLRDRAIDPGNRLGQLYIATTVLTCVTALGIFQHGGFGKPHALALITLVTLGVAWIAGQSNVFGARGRAIAVVSYSASYLFHWIPAITETSTRLPLGKPLLASPEDPALKAATAGLLALFVIGATLQVKALRKR
ncbi:MAG: hypothetical protein JO142_06480 [Burkholderiales bacterium]|nr:hypothetical protein [Burkholderiales bacterium]